MTNGNPPQPNMINMFQSEGQCARACWEVAAKLGFQFLVLLLSLCSILLFPLPLPLPLPLPPSLPLCNPHHLPPSIFRRVSANSSADAVSSWLIMGLTAGMMTYGFYGVYEGNRWVAMDNTCPCFVPSSAHVPFLTRNFLTSWQGAASVQAGEVVYPQHPDAAAPGRGGRRLPREAGEEEGRGGEDHEGRAWLGGGQVGLPHKALDSPTPERHELSWTLGPRRVSPAINVGRALYM